MVSEMQGDLLDLVKRLDPDSDVLLDPFAGSGTVLAEGMARGYNVIGQDINPLSVLACQVLTGPFFIHALQEQIQGLLDRIQDDGRQGIDLQFPGRDKWYTVQVSEQLSWIRKAIMEEEALWARRFFWLCLAETARLSSNSRTSTYKLHIRSEEELEEREVNAERIFIQTVEDNAEQLTAQYEALRDRGFASNGWYNREVTIRYGDTMEDVAGEPGEVDLVVTSPPYGDNRTTVPYGQHSYLPLNWIPRSDIDSDIDDEILRTTQEIDQRSLGGTRYRRTTKENQLREAIPSLRPILDKLDDKPPDRAKRVLLFAEDLERAVESICRPVKSGGHLVWTVGSRTVGGVRIPLDAMIADLLQAHNVEPVKELARIIPQKRMAVKNAITETMSSEKVLIMRKQ